MPNWSDENGNCHFEVNGIPCYQSPDKCPTHGGSWGAQSKTKKPTKTTTELTRLRRENADMARALDEAVKIQKKAVADAYRRGAESMREAAARACEASSWKRPDEYLAQECADDIRCLKIPGDK